VSIKPGIFDVVSHSWVLLLFLNFKKNFFSFIHFVVVLVKHGFGEEL
jgi:hypothetical protein